MATANAAQKLATDLEYTLKMWKIGIINDDEFLQQVEVQTSAEHNAEDDTFAFIQP